MINYLNMIKKFGEFVNEGLWSKGIERSKTGEIRKEDETFFKQDGIYQPSKKFCDYYFLDVDGSILIYHYPKTKPIAKFKEVIIPGDGTCKYDNLQYLNNPTQEEKNTIESKEFIDDISDYWIPF